MRRSRRLFLTSLIVALLAGCGQSSADRTEIPRGSTVPAGSPDASAESVPSGDDSVPARAPEGEAPSHEPMADTWYPWLPSVDPTDDGALPVDSFVRAAADPVPVSAEPGGPPFRFDDGDPSHVDAPLIGIQRGTLLVVLHGPVSFEGDAWYLVTPAQLSIDIPTGWSPVVSPTGSRYLQPTDFACPTNPVEIASLSRVSLTDGLPACYGDEEVTIVGDLACDASRDTNAVGPGWLDPGMCRFDAPPSVFGLDPALKPGRYAVTGRFLDAGARECRSRDGDDSAFGRLIAVLYCRRAFVATSALPAAA